MINITIPTADVTITKKDAPEQSNIYRFTEFQLIPRDKGGIFMFYNDAEELLFVGKARKLRQRIKKHFENKVSVVKNQDRKSTRLNSSHVAISYAVLCLK